MTIDLEDTAGDDAPKPPKVKLWRRPGRFARSHWVFSSFLLAGVIALGGYAWTQVRPFVSSEYRDVSYTVPDAPHLTARPGETVYRIDPATSDAQYGVDETFVGATANHAVGTTHGIAGDLAINASDPSSSRVGQVVVNLEQLHSDNSLRDARIRAGFLDSHDHPLARFTTTALTGLPAKLVDGHTASFKMSGQLTISTVTAPVTWRATATVQDGKLTADAHTTVKMSTFGIGPITIAGLVSTKDDVSLSLHLVALDPTKYAIPNQIAAPVEVSTQKSGGPSFSKQVMPILQAHCASCHNAGQVGASHWQLDTAADASNTASSIGLVTTAKYMPPWPASSAGVPLAHSKALDASDIKVLSDWASAGGSLGVPGGTKIKPTDGSKITIRRDVVMKMPEPYKGSQANPNDYRCFILQPGFTVPTYVTGYQFTPDQIQEIHHAQVFRLPQSTLAGSQAENGADGKPGWSCYAGPGLIGFGGGGGGARLGGAVPAGAARGPGAGTGAGGAGRRAGAVGNSGYGLMAGWAPGQDPVNYPSAGVLFQPGDYLVLQIHYHYTDAPTPDRSTLALQTAPESSNLPLVRVVNPLAPVEIPCAPKDQAAPLCNRDNAIANDAQLYGPAGSFIEPGLLRACGKTPEELTAGFTGTTVSSSCDSRVPANGSIIMVMGHMHTLGKSFRMILDPDTPQQKVLLDIPTWNFDWQMVYQLKTPIQVQRGDTIRIECTWDRSLDPTRAPKYIVFAEGTEDEMCFNTYSLVTGPPGSSGGGGVPVAPGPSTSSGLPAATDPTTAGH